MNLAHPEFDESMVQENLTQESLERVLAKIKLDAKGQPLSLRPTIAYWDGERMVFAEVDPYEGSST